MSTLQDIALSILNAGKDTARSVYNQNFNPNNKNVQKRTQEGKEEWRKTLDYAMNNRGGVQSFEPIVQQLSQKFPQIPDTVESVARFIPDKSAEFAYNINPLNKKLMPGIDPKNNPASNIIGGMARSLVTTPDKVIEANRKIANKEPLTPEDKRALEEYNIGLVAGIATPLKQAGGNTPLKQARTIGEMQAQVEDPLKQAFVQAQNAGDIPGMEKAVREMELDPAYESVASVHRAVLERTKKAMPQVDPIEALKTEARKYKSAEEFVKAQQSRSSKIEFGDITPDPKRGITKNDIELNRQFIETAQLPKYQAMYEVGKKDADVLTDLYNQATALKPDQLLAQLDTAQKSGDYALATQITDKIRETTKTPISRNVNTSDIVTGSDYLDAVKDVQNGVKSMSRLPILVEKNKKGLWEIKDGNHRLAEMVIAGEKNIPVITDEAAYRKLSQLEEDYFNKQAGR